jgi:peptidoglycan/LPS O-acetylase OafA/YrhL
MKQGKGKKISNIFSAPKKNLPEHITQIDILKGLAIISVIFIHVWKPDIYLLIGAPYHIWHAVPMLILIAGFTGAYAYKRRGASTLRQCYDLTLLSRRFKRLLKPYALYWLIQITLLILFFNYQFDLLSLMSNFISGGSGWGAYFVPVIFQSVLVIPLLYLLALRNPDLMVILAIILNIFAEIIILFFGIPRGIASVLYFPFLFAGALGVWLVTSTKRPLGWLFLGGAISLAYLTLTSYTPVLSSFSHFEGYNGMSHAPAYMWTLLLAITGLIYLPKYAVSWMHRCLEIVGKASWHIFLVQMFYFLFVDKIILTYLVYPLAYSMFLSFFFAILIHILVAIIDIILCCVIGYYWYIIEKRYSDIRLAARTAPMN